MQIRKVPQSCHSGKRWIWILEALSNTNPSKKLTVPTISGFTMGHPQLATRLVELPEMEPRNGALWLAVQCGKERLTPSQQVFEHSRLLSNYRVQFWKVSFSEFAECGELSLVEGIRHGITTCDGVHSKKLETCVPESSHDVIDVQHSSIPLLHLHQSLDTQFPYPENENDEYVCVITEDTYDLLSISYSIDNEADHQHVCLFMVEQTFIFTDHQNIGGQRTCAKEAREKSFVRLAFHYDFSVGKR